MFMAFALRRWQRAEMNAARWAIYRLRDELRWDAITNPGQFSEALFKELDEALTSFCGLCQDEYVSLWMFIPAYLKVRKRDRNVATEFQRQLGTERNRELARIYNAAATQVTRVLLWRHVVLVCVATPSIVGVYFLLRWFSDLGRLMLAAPRNDFASRSHAPA